MKNNLFWLVFFLCVGGSWGEGISPVNGGMDGTIQTDTGLPSGWRIKLYHGRETIADVRGIFEEKAIELQWRGGAQGFGVEPELKGTLKKGHDVVIHAFFTTFEKGVAKIGLESFDAAGHILGEQLSSDFKASAGKRFSKQFRLPDGTEKIRVYLLSVNQFPVMVKEFQLEEVPAVHQIAELPFVATPQPATDNIFRDGKSYFTLIHQFPLPLSFHLKGNIRKVITPAIVFDLPENIEFLGAFSAHPGAYRNEIPEITPVKRNGKNYRRYRLVKARTFEILMPVVRAERKVNIILMPGKHAPKNGIEMMYWHGENDGLAGPEEQIELRITPELADRARPKNFRIYRWGTSDFFFPEDAALELAAQNMEKCSADYMVLVGGPTPRVPEFNDFFLRRDWRLGNNSIGGPIEPWRWSEKDLDRLQNPRYAEGHFSGEKFCPEYLTDDANALEVLTTGYLENYLKEKKKYPGVLIALDDEPWGTMEWCFCNYCREKFARRLQIPSVPTSQEIREKYRSQWIQFRCENSALHTKQIITYIRQHYPTSVFYDYNYILDFDNPEAMLSRVAKDPRLMEKDLDGHMPSYYHTVKVKAFESMREGTRHYRKDYLPVCAIAGAGDYLSGEEVLSPEQIRLFTLAAAVNGCPGIAIYPGIHMDGAFWHAFRTATSEIAAIEDFCPVKVPDAAGVSVSPLSYRERKFKRGGKPVSVIYPDWTPAFAFRAKQHGEEYLVGVFNYHDKEQMFFSLTADLPAGKRYTVQDAISGENLVKNAEPVQLKKGILWQIVHEDAVLLKIRESSPTDAEPLKSQELLQNRYEQAKKSYGKDGFAALSERGWRIFEKEDVGGIIQVEGPEQIWELNTATASLEKGKCGSVEWAYQMMLERIWTPDFLKGRVPRYQCPKASIRNDGSAELSFYGVFPPKNIPVQKIITFSPQGKVCVSWSSIPNTFLKIQNFVSINSTATALSSEKGPFSMPLSRTGEACWASEVANWVYPVPPEKDLLTAHSILLQNNPGQAEFSFSAVPKCIYQWRSDNSKQKTLEWITDLTAGLQITFQLKP